MRYILLPEKLLAVLSDVFAYLNGGDSVEEDFCDVLRFLGYPSNFNPIFCKLCNNSTNFIFSLRLCIISSDIIRRVYS